LARGERHFLTRAAYLILKYQVPDKLFLNMDETPLHHVVSMGKTWAKRNSSNVSTQGGKDKRQETGTPWMNLCGGIVFFHTTVKGKTDRCLLPAYFRNQSMFSKILFGFSENHWVSKHTMRQQIMRAEDYRRQVVEARRLQEDQKMMILWDVYCRHRDKDLLTHIREEYPHIIILFVPANLTDICQPLDIYFNAEFKVTLASLRNKRVADMFDSWRERVN
jgi:hypothetical protein